jgi:hypothetical protein
MSQAEPTEPIENNTTPYNQQPRLITITCLFCNRVESKMQLPGPRPRYCTEHAELVGRMRTRDRQAKYRRTHVETEEQKVKRRERQKAYHQHQRAQHNSE